VGPGRRSLDGGAVTEGCLERNRATWDGWAEGFAERDRERWATLLELQAPEDGTTTVDWVSLEWARRYPTDEVWKARKRR
jgi:hypothetical protein